MGRSVKKVPGTEGYRTVMSHIIDDDCHGYTTFTQKTKGVSATSFVRVTICVPLHLFGEHENSVLEFVLSLECAQTAGTFSGSECSLERSHRTRYSIGSF